MDTLSLYKKKLKEALELVPALGSDHKIAAVAYWNESAEQLQEIVHKNDASFQLAATTSSHDSHVQIEQLPDAIYNGPTMEPDLPMGAIQIDPSVMISVSTGTTSPLYDVSSPPMECDLNTEQLEATTCLGTHGTPIMPLNQQQVYTVLKHPEFISSLGNSQDTSKSIMNLAEVLSAESYCPNQEVRNLQTSHHLLEALQQEAINVPEKNLSTKLELATNVNMSDYNSAILSTSPVDSVELTPTSMTADLKDDRCASCPKLYEVPIEFNHFQSNQTVVMSHANFISPRDEMYTQSERPLQQIQLYNPNSSEHLNHTLYSITGNKFKTDNPFDNKKFEKLELSEKNLLNSIKIEMGSSPMEEYKNEFDIIDASRPNSNAQHTCEVCGKSGFSTKGNLKRHLRAHSGEKPFKCEYCDSCFTEKKSLKIHVRRHTGEKPYKCEICGKLFSQTGVLQSHMALHLNERKFDCQKCGKAFRQRSQLKLHLMRHDGVKRLECSTCKAKFLTKGDLERHCRIHTGERPYACEICEKTFTRQQSLNEHMNRHTGRRPYDCKYCDKTFSEMSACYKHAKTHKKQAQTQQEIPNLI